MKKITPDQITAILQAIYQTNISAATFDQIKKLFSELEEIKEEDKPKK